jgi:hypothetical protein
MVKKKIDDEDEDVEPEEEEEQEIDEQDGEVEDNDDTEDNDVADPPHVEDEPTKPEKVGNIDSLVFLKEYSKDTSRQYAGVASKLGISKSSAHDFLHKYLYLVKETMSDADFPRRARLVLNKNVPEKYQITVDEIIKLKPLLWIYGKVPPPAVDAQPYNQSDSAYTYDNMSFDP